MKVHQSDVGFPTTGAPLISNCCHDSVYLQSTISIYMTLWAEGDPFCYPSREYLIPIIKVNKVF